VGPCLDEFRYFVARCLHLRDVVRDEFTDPLLRRRNGAVSPEALRRRIDDLTVRIAQARMKVEIASTLQDANFPLVQGPNAYRRRKRVVQGWQ
jgi:hypothetical protein